MNVRVNTKVAISRVRIRTEINMILIPSWWMLEIHIPWVNGTLSFKPFRRTNEFDKLFSFKIWKGEPLEHR